MGFAEYSASKSHRKLPRRTSLSLSLSYRARNGNTIKSSAISKSARALPRSAYLELEADGTRLRAYRRWNTWSKTQCVAPRARGNPRRDCKREGRREPGRGIGLSLPGAKPPIDTASLLAAGASSLHRGCVTERIREIEIEIDG